MDFTFKPPWHLSPLIRKNCSSDMNEELARIAKPGARCPGDKVNSFLPTRAGVTLVFHVSVSLNCRVRIYVRADTK